MVQPTNTVNKKARFDFCSCSNTTKNVAINPRPTICKMSMADPSYPRNKKTSLIFWNKSLTMEATINKI